MCLLVYVCDDRLIVIPHVRSTYCGSPFIHTATCEVGDSVPILQMRDRAEM